jgi:DNA-binding HxlR family transcriptional regulator
MKWKELEEEPCSMARTIAVIGDRWTLLILRECFLRVRRFEAFQAPLQHHPPPARRPAAQAD